MGFSCGPFACTRTPYSHFLRSRPEKKFSAQVMKIYFQIRHNIYLQTQNAHLYRAFYVCELVEATVPFLLGQPLFYSSEIYIKLDYLKGKLTTLPSAIDFSAASMTSRDWRPSSPVIKGDLF